MLGSVLQIWKRSLAQSMILLPAIDDSTLSAWIRFFRRASFSVRNEAPSFFS
jgi:hypothetical protein